MTLEILIGEIEESSAGTITATFRDAAGTLVVPTSVWYRLDCITTGTAIKILTAISPASTVTIPLLPAENAILAASNEYELKEITIVADKDLTTQSVKSAKWKVQNAAYF